MKKIQRLFLMTAITLASIPALAHGGYTTTQIHANHQIQWSNGKYVSVQYSTAKVQLPRGHYKPRYHAPKPKPRVKHHHGHSHYPHRPHH